MNYKIAIVNNNDILMFAADELKKYLQMIDNSARILIMEKDELSSANDIISIGVDLLKLPKVKDKKFDDAIAIDMINGATHKAQKRRFWTFVTLTKRQKDSF